MKLSHDVRLIMFEAVVPFGIWLLNSVRISSSSLLMIPGVIQQVAVETVFLY